MKNGKVEEKNEKVKIRNSSFELMRIISMLMIAFGHFLIHGNVYSHGTQNSDIAFSLIMAVMIIHVNSFVLVTGYFQSENEFKLSKAIKLNNSSWFYRAVIMLILIYFFKYEETTVNYLSNLLPISLYKDYWFISDYLVLYLISPYLNTVIKNINKQQYKGMLMVLFILLSVLPCISSQQIYLNNGAGIVNFSLLYLIGAYFKKYPITKSTLLKNVSVSKLRLILFFSVFFMAGLNFLLNSFGQSVLNQSNNPILVNICTGFVHSYLMYSNPLVIIQSVCYLLFFSLLTFKSNFINKIASCVFGVYLITENIYIRNIMYDNLGFTKDGYNINILFYAALCTLVIFVICIIIEMIRQFIFKKIYNTKFAEKNRNKVIKYIQSLGIRVNW